MTAAATSRQKTSPRHSDSAAAQLAWDHPKRPISPSDLLTDDQVISFVINGYILLRPAFPTGLNQKIHGKLKAMKENPNDGILDAVSELHDVWGHPTVRGALVSLLGEDVEMDPHRHCHINPPTPYSQPWHQDGTNVRCHRLITVLGLYYPHDVTATMGPTVIMPGTHLRNAPTDRMATYTNLRGQVALAVEAGTVAVTHYDIWHAASVNKSHQTRYMLKFLFNRDSEIAAPSWNHDPAAADTLARRRLEGDNACLCSQSDHYKEACLRFEMWNDLLGKGRVQPRGLGNPADRDLKPKRQR